MTTETMVAANAQAGSDNMSAVALQVRQIIVDMLGVEAPAVVATATFAGDLGADSLDVFELMIGLEKAFDCTIPSEEAEKMYTVGSVVSWIENHVKT